MRFHDFPGEPAPGFTITVIENIFPASNLNFRCLTSVHDLYPCPAGMEKRIPPFSQISSILQNITVTANFAFLEEGLTEFPQFTVLSCVYWAVVFKHVGMLNPPNREVKRFDFTHPWRCSWSTDMCLQTVVLYLYPQPLAQKKTPNFLAEIFPNLLSLGFTGSLSWKIWISKWLKFDNVVIKM